MAEFRAYAVGDGIYLVDAFMGSIPNFAAVYAVTGSEGIALIDTAVSGSAESILAGLRFLELDADDVRYVVITHLHLDHAGGAGFLLPVLRNATVVADELAIPHLADPQRLMESARRALGKFAPLYGDLAPIPHERMLEASEGMTLDLGGRSLKLLYCPGHARTHWCPVDSSTGALFSGDALGVYLRSSEMVFPVTPLPDFDVHEMRKTLARLRDLDAPATYFPHFGEGGSSRKLAQDSLEALEVIIEIIAQGLSEGQERSLIVENVLARFPAKEERERMLLIGNVQLNLGGISRMLEKEG
jgi:glyoxylase-like metal-dependent hydrolase (beta-lactamase superfamily II)